MQPGDVPTTPEETASRPAPGVGSAAEQAEARARLNEALARLRQVRAAQGSPSAASRPDAGSPRAAAAEATSPTEIRARLSSLASELAAPRSGPARPEPSVVRPRPSEPPAPAASGFAAEPAPPTAAPEPAAQPAPSAAPEHPAPVRPAEADSLAAPVEAPPSTAPFEDAWGRQRVYRRPPRARRARTTLLMLLVGAALILAAIVGTALWCARQMALDSYQRLANVRERLVADPPSQPLIGPTLEDRAPAVIRQACTQAEELERGLGSLSGLAGVAAPANRLVNGLPQVGEQAAGLLTLAAAGGEALGALRSACEALEPTLQAQASGGDLSALVASLAAGRDRLRESTARLRSAQGQLATVDERALDDTTRGFFVTLRDRLPAVTARLTLLAELPGLLGSDDARTYLILGQNNDELRPTGGFIGTTGLLTFDHGKLARREYRGSAALNLPPNLLVSPPEPLRRYMDAGFWHLREANWWPDYPSSARQTEYFYRLARPDELAGVVAIDQDLVVMLLDLVGPVDVPDYGETVSSANVRERLEYYVHLVAHDNEASEKGFVTALFSAVLDRVDALPRDRLSALAGLFDHALKEQHLLIWTDDPATQQAIANLGWDGRMLATGGDYLFPVSANLGANKINREVEQQLDYEVQPDADGHLIGRATLRLRNRHESTDPGPYPTADYRDYLRLYVPARSTLISGTGLDAAPESGSECGRAVFGGLVTVKPGEQRQVQLTYRLPPALQASSYTLLVQKQPGTAPFPLRVSGPGSAGGLTSTLDEAQAFAATDGRLTTARRTPPGPGSASEPACAIRTEPPRVLRPPTQIAIPRLGISADTVDLGVEPDGTLEAPATGGVIGWYRQSGRPGQIGNMIVSGHVDWDKQPAVFWRLGELQAGDRVEVFAQGGARYRYEVEWSKSVDPASAPLGEILGPTSERWLTLITCGGPFDARTRSYRERAIVRAKLVTSG